MQQSGSSGDVAMQQSSSKYSSGVTMQQSSSELSIGDGAMQQSRSSGDVAMQQSGSKYSSGVTMQQSSSEFSIGDGAMQQSGSSGDVAMQQSSREYSSGDGAMQQSSREYSSGDVAMQQSGRSDVTAMQQSSSKYSSGVTMQPSSSEYSSGDVAMQQSGSSGDGAMQQSECISDDNGEAIQQGNDGCCSDVVVQPCTDEFSSGVGVACYSPGMFVAVKIEGNRKHNIYVAQVQAVDDDVLHLKYLKRTGSNIYVWPIREDSSWEPMESVISPVTLHLGHGRSLQFALSTEDHTALSEVMKKNKYRLC
ncbi:sericin-2-like [Ptychodera flava]|uniref:sericin-2-like n=1 Tax=Ptychodera flava TaxID=63121 RepID=UPI003969F368